MSSGQSLLYLEDEPLVSRALSRLLRRAGYDVTPVDDCLAARKTQGPFRLGVFDIDLPDGDGITVAQELMELGTVSEVCFYTGCKANLALDGIADLGPVFEKSQGLDALLSFLESAAPRSRVSRMPQPASDCPAADGARRHSA